MILPIRSQGFPDLITELGIQSPLSGPFWGFESTVLPTIDVRNPRNLPRSGVVYDGFASVGQIPLPAANSILAQTNTVLFRGAWALSLNWAWVNTTASNCFIAFQRWNDTFTVLLEEEILDVIGQPALGERQIGSGHRELVIQKNNFGEPWALTNLQALGAAGSVLYGSIRMRYLGQIEGPTGF